jgi:hypothetical protein
MCSLPLSCSGLYGDAFEVYSDLLLHGDPEGLEDWQTWGGYDYILPG